MSNHDEKWVDFEPEMIPPQHEGTALEARSSQEFQDSDTAKMAYLKARQRLLDVNHWSRYIDGITAVFQLMNQNNEPVEGIAEKGLLIRVDIPGPGTSTGDGYDWVIIDDLEEGSTAELDYLAFRVKPTENPSKEDAQTAHFFSAGSSGTFVLCRENKNVTCTVYDRNLKANTALTGNLSDIVRNTFVGTAAARGMSGIQWQKLVDSVWE